ncbi:MAG: glycerophosphodiester phosphodiesterase [Hyphomicrobiales bacterium]|nr:glycerophosphodiester phosphodiesterase [Hyphomicrobiales bacterium]
MPAEPWLVARPIAHRGFHDRAAGRIENSVTAARAAIARGYAIECDVQISCDGEAMVFHDDELDRLTGATGRVDARSAQELARIGLSDGADTIASLPDWLATIEGATPVICEIKSGFDGDLRLAARTAQIVASYAGPIALKSFDPDIIAYLRRDADAFGIGHVPLGIVAEATYQGDDWPMLTDEQRRNMSALTHWSTTRPDFLSWRVADLPHATASLCRAYGVPVMTWTVRTPGDVARAGAYADQMIFEGFAA